jgi:hypothetical protein
MLSAEREAYDSLDLSSLHPDLPLELSPEDTLIELVA